MSKWYSMLPYCKQYLALKEKKKMSAFCREQGINYDAFRSAKARYMSKHKNNTPSVEIAPVVISSEVTKCPVINKLPSGSQKSTLHNFTICYSNGVSLNLSSAEISMIAQLINLQAQ